MRRSPITLFEALRSLRSEPGLRQCFLGTAAKWSADAVTPEAFRVCTSWRRFLLTPPAGIRQTLFMASCALIEWPSGAENALAAAFGFCLAKFAVNESCFFCPTNFQKLNAPSKPSGVQTCARQLWHLAVNTEIPPWRDHMRTIFLPEPGTLALPCEQTRKLLLAVDHRRVQSCHHRNNVAA